MFKNKGGIIYLVLLAITIIVVIFLYFQYGGDSEVNEQLSNKAEITTFDAEKEKELKEKADIFFASVSSLPKQDISSEKVALGKKLFFDKRLSKNETISCNSCHNMNTYGVDNIALSPGDTEEFGNRNSPTVFYAHMHAMQFWDGRAKDVEEQAGGPILNPVEHNIPSEAFLEERLRGIEEYQTMFAAAYPDSAEAITFATITNAIGAFERQLNPVSRFDEWLDGDSEAMTAQEKEGLTVFINNACITCHNGAALGGNMLQKFGLNGDYWEHTMSEVIDNGVYDLTKEERDKFKFKTPGLRNVEKTYPYFHDGSVEKLEDAVRIMGKLQVANELTEEEVQSVTAFLKALTADVDDEFKE
ncbi:cytochrome-c peroxidase [Brumimicrobium oceani]|uniref:Cytochrome-c peroxidase n=1 Tax=Brumimicrobium oceani TaxID=2100725 RepID=A0A2U2XCU6_9FLAO|nr:cytochrome-c peroxidase [Brumimicrobium oceani]PWH85531.1 cytochrome-c peroxidase [Brumimicrobium oceani]